MIFAGAGMLPATENPFPGAVKPSSTPENTFLETDRSLTRPYKSIFRDKSPLHLPQKINL